jgi:glucose/arabinose dehydrogenase
MTRPFHVSVAFRVAPGLSGEPRRANLQRVVIDAVINQNLNAPARRLIAVSLTLVALLAAPTPAAAALPLTLVEGGYTEPVGVVNAGDSRLFVLEKGGRIKIVGGGTFLDISAKVGESGERGLLSVAFHPNYGSNGLFFASYNRDSDGDIILSEFRRSAGDADVADPDYERQVLRIEHSSASNHNGGTIFFHNNLLFMTVGDGGGSPGTRSQDLSLLVGKILRINPLDPDGNGVKTYSVPNGNPYVGRSGLDEIWARGLRNPWRCSIDPTTARIYCGDVGAGAWEEINRVPTSKKAANYGWPLLEGTHYYNFPNEDQGDPCTHDCRYLPVVEYPHSVDGDDNHAVTGGYVSRRPGANLNGMYVFGDYGSGRVWAIAWNAPRGTPMPAPLADTDYSISSFGEGADKRLYLVDLGGAVYRLDDS